MVDVPADTMCIRFPFTVATAGLLLEYVTVSPDEEEAPGAKSGSVTIFDGIAANVMVCPALETTRDEVRFAAAL